MNDLSKLNNTREDDKDFAACSLFGMMSIDGKRFSSKDAIRAMVNMHDRGNGLGAGFAAYGIYPEYKNDYALHIMYLCGDAKEKTEKILSKSFEIIHDERIPTKEANVRNPPLTLRYFVQQKKPSSKNLMDNHVVETVMKINTTVDDAFVFSSGKNIGVFKGVGFPEDIADFFRLEEYEGYMWVCHSRFPTNTPGWWVGAHPFNILDWTVAHNGELSSYGINRRYLEMFGYEFTMQTDTEVLAYAFDLLMRKQELHIEIVAKILAAPFRSEIDILEPLEKKAMTALRQTYASLLMNGPFSIIVAHQGEMIGLTDRLKLRPLVAGLNRDMFFLSSEEAAIRLISPKLDLCWSPRGGEPVVSRLKTDKAIETLTTEAKHR